MSKPRLLQHLTHVEKIDSDDELCTLRLLWGYAISACV